MGDLRPSMQIQSYWKAQRCTHFRVVWLEDHPMCMLIHQAHNFGGNDRQPHSTCISDSTQCRDAWIFPIMSAAADPQTCQPE